MANYITVDGGTTNTRVSLVKDGRVVDTQKFNVGARASMDGNAALVATVRDAISSILAKDGLTEGDITRILASGMLTSEFGLYKLDHISTPAGIRELHASMAEVTLDAISSIPFVFIRGVRTESRDLGNADMMRGEETEIMGLVDSGDGDCVYILPGSHSKVIRLDGEGRIADFSTMLTGEMIASLSQNTILKDAVDLSGAELDGKYLLEGFDYCRECGINKALFKVRVLKNLFGGSRDAAYSFFMGAVLCGELCEVIKASPRKVAVGGKKQIKVATCAILSARASCEVVSISDAAVDASTSAGLVKIYEYKA